MINKRIFGTPITGVVKRKLESRQGGAGAAKTETKVFRAQGADIPQLFPEKELNVTIGTEENPIAAPKQGGTIEVTTTSAFEPQEYLYNTPFVRMWTSLKFIGEATIFRELEEIPQERINQLSTQFSEDDELIKRLEFQYGPRKVEVGPDDVRIENPAQQIVMREDENGLKRYYIKGFDIEENADFARKIYVVGNHEYLQRYGTKEANESVEPEFISAADNPETEQDERQAGFDVFPHEAQDNPLRKPQAGITSVTSETEGTLGVVKKTTINFVVHNYYDFDRIYNRYFLKPGATIFLDFGWSNIKNFYNPNDLIKAPDIQQFLYAEEEDFEDGVSQKPGVVVENEGDLEVIQGIVTDYGAKVLKNGSVQCSVTLTSANATLLDFNTDEKTTRQTQLTLNQGILYLGVKSILQNAKGEPREDVNLPGTSLEYQANQDATADEIIKFENELFALSAKSLYSEGLTPKGNQIRTGVFVNSLEIDDVYTSWGVIEDIIFNQQFGFGKTNDDINKGVNFNVRIDSSNSFTTWNEVFSKRQQILANVPEEPPTFIYPEWWGGSVPDVESDGTLESGKIQGGSYSYFNDKYPKDDYDNENVIDSNHTSHDIGKKRIPIREVFINTETVLNAFRRNDNVKKILDDILNAINKDSNGVYDWKVVTGATDSELSIIDNNKPGVQGIIEDNDLSFQTMFTFRIMSENSQVKDYDLDFKLPSGNIGNMYAISAMSHQNKILPLSSELDDALAISSLESFANSIIYEPDNGRYRIEQINSLENSDSNTFNVFENANYLIDTNLYKVPQMRVYDDLLQDGQKTNKTSQSEVKEATGPEEDDLFQNRYIDANIRKLTGLGFKVSNSFKDYFRIKEVQDVALKDKPNILPFTLTLTIPGIATLQPGDTFRVDYLPQIYLKNVYLQVMKIIHNVNSDGWFTTLETQFRIKPEVKKQHYVDIDRNLVRLSPLVLNTLKLAKITSNTSIDSNSQAGAFDGSNMVEIAELLPYITDLNIVETPLNHMTMLLSFVTTPEINNTGGNGGLGDYKFTAQRDDGRGNVSTGFQNTTAHYFTYNYPMDLDTESYFQRNNPNITSIKSATPGGVPDYFYNTGGRGVTKETTHVRPTAADIKWEENSENKYYLGIRDGDCFIAESFEKAKAFDRPRPSRFVQKASGENLIKQVFNIISEQLNDRFETTEGGKRLFVDPGRTDDYKRQR